jgi:hypothetical protein
LNRTEFLNYLKGLPATGKALSGQHLDESDPQGSYNRLVAPLPDVPVILGGSPRVGQNDDQRPNATLLSIMADHATKGGVVELECHFANPWLPTPQPSPTPPAPVPLPTPAPAPAPPLPSPSSPATGIPNPWSSIRGPFS